MPWTVEKTFCVETYFETKSIVAVQARLKIRFKCRDCPDKKIMYTRVYKFRAHEIILNLLPRVTEQPIPVGLRVFDLRSILMLSGIR